MHRIGIIFAVVMSVSSAALAQEFAEYQNTQDGFKIDFPGQPKVTAITWTSEHGFMLPARVYSADRGRERYAVTVVDYSGIEQMGIERAKSCPPGAEPCLGSDLAGVGYWKHDVRGAVLFATARMIKGKNVTLDELTWQQEDLVEGNQVQVTNTTDQSRTFAFIGMHEMKLFIVEGTVPKGYPPPALFQTALGWVDKNGNGIRYQSIYNNEFHVLEHYPVPGHAGGGGGQGGRGGGGGRGGRRGGGAGDAPQQ
jgi:uncharacterized membrane protein YgcG